MKKVFCDTSIFVAASVVEHGHHQRASSLLIEIAKNKKLKKYVSEHSLLEIYAVLTRIPISPRISSAQALQIIERNVLSSFEIISLEASEYHNILKEVARAGIIGGSIYDALILASAKKIKADQVYTFNLKELRKIDSSLSERIVAP